MNTGIVCHSGNAVIFVRVIRAFKIHIIFYHRFDHFHAVLKMHVIVRSTMNNEELSLYSVRKIQW